MERRAVRTDSEMRQDVMNALRGDPMCAAAPLEVIVRAGLVTLRGHVWSRAEKIAAKAAAAGVTGVRGVIAEIEVRTTPSAESTDGALAMRARRALSQQPFVPRGAIVLSVDHGDVTLTGTVAYEYQRSAAERALRDLPGLGVVRNEVRVARAQMTTAAIQSDIASALTPSLALDATRIDVSFDHGTVMLRGTVRTWADRRRAEAAARQAPGVMRVVNLLIVRAIG
jgi:osmotically-inducible protein OsmY